MRPSFVTACLAAVVFSSCAGPSSAQVDPRRIIEQFVRPGGVIDNMARPQGPVVQPQLSDRPSIACNRALSPVGQILCSDRQGAGADWDLNATMWAIDGSLDEPQKKAFQAEQQGWRSSLDSRCGIAPGPGFFNPNQRTCVIKAFHDRAASLRTRLSGEALEESKLSPEDRARIQEALVTRRFLADSPDGEFGSNTRQAIRSFQNSEKAKATGFLTSEQRDRLLADMRSPAAPAAGASTSPNAGYDNSKPGPPSPDASAVQVQAGPPFLMRVYGPRQSSFAIGRIASADEICTQLKHPVFSHDPSNYVANNSPISLDPQNLGLKWVADRLASLGLARSTLELDEATKVAVDENLKACLRTIAAEGGDRIANIGRLLLTNLNAQCFLTSAETRMESYLGPSGEMLQRPARTQSQPRGCTSWSVMQASSVYGPIGYQILLTLAEAHPAFQTLLGNAETTVQAAIAARTAERLQQEQRQRALDEARRKANEERIATEGRERQRLADQKAEQQRLAEEKLTAQRALAQTKGIEYANRRETTWSLSSKTDEMSDKTALEAFSVQATPNGVVANVKVRCFDKNLSITVLIVDRDGKPTVSLPTTEFLGSMLVKGQLRLNEDDPTIVFLRPAGDFRNELDVLSSIDSSLTDGARWRLYVSVPTNVEPIIVKIPLFEQAVQKTIKSCS